MQCVCSRWRFDCVFKCSSVCFYVVFVFFVAFEWLFMCFCDCAMCFSCVLGAFRRVALESKLGLPLQPVIQVSGSSNKCREDEAWFLDVFNLQLGLVCFQSVLSSSFLCKFCFKIVFWGFCLAQNSGVWVIVVKMNICFPRPLLSLCFSTRSVGFWSFYGGWWCVVMVFARFWLFLCVLSLFLSDFVHLPIGVNAVWMLSDDSIVFLSVHLFVFTSCVCFCGVWMSLGLVDVW